MSLLSHLTYGVNEESLEIHTETDRYKIIKDILADFSLLIALLENSILYDSPERYLIINQYLNDSNSLFAKLPNPLLCNGSHTDSIIDDFVPFRYDIKVSIDTSFIEDEYDYVLREHLIGKIIRNNFSI